MADIRAVEPALWVGVVEGCFMDRLVAVAVYSCRRHLFQRSAAAAVAAVHNGDE